MKTLWRSFVLATSMYSKLPTPKTEWSDRSMAYVFCFFPWIGLVIGGLELIWFWLAEALHMGGLLFAAVALLPRLAPPYLGVKVPHQEAPQKIAVLNMVEVAAEIARTTPDQEAAAIAMGAAALYLADLQKDHVVVLSGQSVLAAPEELKITAGDFLKMSGVAQKLADEAKAKAGNAAPK